MQTIKTLVDISASPEVVWRVLTDFVAYPKWNPLLRAVQGDPVQGRRLKIRARLSRNNVYRFSARVIKAVPASELCVRGKLWIKGVFEPEYTAIIIPNGINGVRFAQRTSFSGLLAPLIFPFIQARFKERFELMSSALKKTAEAKH